jgi:ElaB/YqjD/DUF883 family membrane-anchored ribosome-binding protein
MSDELTETDQIEQDLARTRERMDQRLDALQDKMAPAQIVNDAFAHLGGNDGGAFAENLIARAKANPLAVALVGAGFAWLMMPNARGSQLRQDDEDLSSRLRWAESQVHREQDEHDDAFDTRVLAARGRVLGVERNLDEPSASYSGRIRQALSAARQTLREGAHDAHARARTALSDAGDHVGRGAHSLHQGSRSMAQNTRTSLAALKSNPLALGGLAAVAGLVVGAILPTTELEERSLGSAAGKLKETGRDMVQELADTGGRVVNQALDTARESASREGLTADTSVGDAFAALKSGELVSGVKQVASDTLEAGKAAAKPDAGPEHVQSGQV